MKQLHDSQEITLDHLVALHEALQSDSAEGERARELLEMLRQLAGSGG